MAVTKEDVLQRLASVRTPNGGPLSEAGVLSDIVANEGKVFFSINVPAEAVRHWEAVRKAAEDAVRGMPGVTSALIALTAERRPGAATAQQTSAGRPNPASAANQSRGAQNPPGVKSIIAVASGKGGVGKSTTAANIALGLRDIGLKVGLLDADIYGPSVPKLLGLRDKPETLGGTRLKPLTGYGLTVMSIGFLVEEESPMIWRGPMVMSALTQMLREVEWGELDIMVVDMPPGTGDAQLTMAQQVPLAGAVIVSTPQDLALIDARRGIAMFRRVDVPVLGLIENMSYFICPHCQGRSEIFGHGGARHEAERFGIPFLGEIPLQMEIREMSDAGKPIVAVAPNGAHAAIYRGIAERIWQRLGSGGGARTAPRIVIES